MSIVKNLGIGKEAYTKARANEINDIIKDLLPDFPTGTTAKDPQSVSSGILTGVDIPLSMRSGLDVAGSTILCSFRPCCPGSLNCTFPLTREIIFRRLVLIDSLFSTNTNKGCFIKQNMADAIYDACDDGTGVHSDYTLAKKASDYILWTINSPFAPTPEDKNVINEIDNLLHKKYTWVKKKPGNAQMELSLMTKYLHWLVESVHRINPNFHTDGFPIKDSLVNQMLPKVYRYLFGKNVGKHSTFADYTKALGEIANALKTNDPTLWTRSDMTIFHILDLFMWQLGKVYKAHGDYTQLWMVTEAEFNQMLKTGVIIPRFQKLEHLAKIL